MKKAIVKLVGIGCAWMSPLWAMAQTDSLRVDKQYEVQEVVVTGTRNETDIRHLPMTISVVGKRTLEENYRTSIADPMMITLTVLVSSIAYFIATMQ